MQGRKPFVDMQDVYGKAKFFIYLKKKINYYFSMRAQTLNFFNISKEL